MLNYTKEGVRLYLFLENRYANKNSLRTVKLVIYHRATSKYYPSGISLTEEDWTTISNSKKKDLVEKRKSLENSFFKYKTIIDTLIDKNQFSFEKVEDLLETKPKNNLFLKDYFDKKVEALQNGNQFSTANNYALSFKSFCTFDSRKLELRHITVDWLKKYEHYMLEKNRTYTTISMYVRNLRTIMNEAISSGTMDRSAYPFGRGKYEIPAVAKRKLALPLDTIKNISDYTRAKID